MPSLHTPCRLNWRPLHCPDRVALEILGECPRTRGRAAEIRINSMLAGSDEVDVNGEKLVKSKDAVQAGEKVRWEALVDAANVHDRARLMGLREVRDFAGCRKMSRAWLEGAPSQVLYTRLFNEELSSSICRRLGIN